MTAINLIQYLPVPSNPVETGSLTSWLDVESRLGLKLPQDYKAFINNYGTVVIADFLTVLNPFSERVQYNLFSKGEAMINILLEVHRLGDTVLDNFTLYPHAGGLLPWGFTDFGHTLCWLTNGSPDEWNSIILEPRSLKYEVANTIMTGVILSITKKNAAIKILPRARGKIFAEVL
jgi:hypothetical protein